jgi:hypothetical protein
MLRLMMTTTTTIMVVVMMVMIAQREATKIVVHLKKAATLGSDRQKVQSRRMTQVVMTPF